MALSSSEKSFTAIFSVIVSIELLSIGLINFSSLHYISKPLIVLSLICFFLLQGKHLEKKTRSLTLFALVFSLIGDILLIFHPESSYYFVSGLSSFLLAHVMYILIFLYRRNKKVKPIGYFIGLTTYALALFYILYKGLGDLLVPVILYVAAIFAMTISAAMRKDIVSKLSYNLVLIGSLLFILSDSLLALNKFNSPIPLAHVSIMFTYAFAQYCIVMGILKQKS